MLARKVKETGYVAFSGYALYVPYDRRYFYFRVQDKNLQCYQGNVNQDQVFQIINFN